jgi:hypothetical protein
MTMGENNLYVADIDNSRVAWSGLTNTAWTTLLGSNVLNRPEDVVWDPRGFLYVADTLHHRVIRIPITANATNDAVHPTALASTPSSNSFTIFWYGGSNWYYTIQYADSLQATGTWQVLAGATNILGRSAITNYTDRTVGGATNRFYRIIAY